MRWHMQAANVVIVSVLVYASLWQNAMRKVLSGGPHQSHSFMYTERFCYAYTCIYHCLFDALARR